MKLMFFLISLSMLSACATSNFASKSLRFTNPVATADAQLVFDKNMDTKKPLNFRKNEELKMSGSASFSDSGAKMISKVAPVILVMDLRQESHGLINGKPVTWQSDRDWANVGMNVDEAIQREKRFLSEIHIGEKVAGSKVRSVETEESLVRSLGQSYLRLAVTDHVRPSDAQIERFLEAVHNMPQTSWVHFHGRAGKSRTTTFMIMYDMLRSAWSTSYADIISRNQKLSGDFTVTDISAEGDWKRPFQEDRVAFFEEFYKYAKANPNGEPVGWSGWAH